MTTRRRRQPMVPVATPDAPQLAAAVAASPVAIIGTAAVAAAAASSSSTPSPPPTDDTDDDDDDQGADDSDDESNEPTYVTLSRERNQETFYIPEEYLRELEAGVEREMLKWELRRSEHPTPVYGNRPLADMTRATYEKHRRGKT
jgi:hypothetical protein